MSHIQRASLGLLSLLLGAWPLVAQESPIKLADIDKLRNFASIDVACRLTVLNTNPKGEQTSTEARYFRRDREEKFSMIITAPNSQLGQGYLMIGDNLLFYDPDTRATSHRTIKDSFQGSKARNDDFTAASFAKDYTLISAKPAKIKNMDVYILDIKANNDLVPYARQKLWVRADLPLILKQECYASSGKLLITYAYPKYSLIKGTYVPEKILVRDEVHTGESSEISLREISVDPLPNRYFTEGFLEANGR